MPGSIVKRINAAVNEALNANDMKASLAELGFNAKGGSVRDFAALIAADTGNWSAVVETANIKLSGGN